MSRILHAIIVSLVLQFIFLVPSYAAMYINEVMPESTDYGSWVEIYTTDNEVSLDDHIITSINDIDSSCSVVSNNSYVYNLSGNYSTKHILVEDPTLSFNTDLVLYLVNCSEQTIESTLFVPLMGEDFAYARDYDGSINASERHYNISYLNTKGSTNNVVPIIENLSLDKNEYNEGEYPEVNFELVASEDDFDEVRLYLNGYLISRLDEYKDFYEVEVTSDDYFFSGGNNLKIEARSSVGSSQEIISFDYISTNSTITYKTIHSQDFSDPISVSGVVSSNGLLQKVSLKYKKVGTSQYVEQESVDLTSKGLYRYNYNFNFLPKTPGEYLIMVEVEDENYTNSAEYKNKLTFDPNAPKANLNLDPENPDGKDDYYISDVEVEITSSEDGADIYYRWGDSGPWLEYTGKFDVLEGDNLLQYKTIDSVGNESGTSEKRIKVDTIDPDVYITLDPELPDGLNGYYLEEPEVKFNSFFDDIAKYEYSFDKVSWITYEDTYIVKDGTGVFFYRSLDKAGNKSEVKFFNLQTALEKPNIIRSIDYELTKSNSLIISWNDYNTDETYLYEIYKSLDPNIKIDRDSFYTAVPSTEDSYIDSNMAPGQTYYYLLVKKDKAGKISDPVRFEVSVPGSLVLGKKELTGTLMYLAEGPVVTSEEPFTIDSNGDVLAAKDTPMRYTLMFFVSLSFFAFFLMKYVYKLRTQNAS